jgi:hypothetical protein
MKKTALVLGIAVLLMPHDCLAVDLGQIGKTVETLGMKNALDAAGIDLSRITDYLDWETINISLAADMANTTTMMGKTVTVDGMLYKKGLSNVRIDLKSELEVPGKDSIRLTDCFILDELLEKQAYIVFPLKEAYVKIDPDDVLEMLGQFQKKRDGKAKIEKKEDLGSETVDGIDCKKVHIIMTMANGTQNDITAWLAKELKGFPIKIAVDFKPLRGKPGTSVTTFSNIATTDPDAALFSIPEGYVQYDNFVQVATHGKQRSRRGSTSDTRKKSKPIEKQN